MRFFFLTLMCVAFFFVPAYAEDEHDVQVERGVVASNLFKRICFMMHSSSQTDKRLEFLNSEFPKFENGRQDLFLKAMKVQNGDAWGAVFPKGNFVIVVDYDTTNCHVIAQKADAQTVHDQIKALSDQASGKLDKLKVEYHERAQAGDKLESSGFDVRSSEGNVLTVVVASTPHTPDPNKPEAILTVAVK